MIPCSTVVDGVEECTDSYLTNSLRFTMYILDVYTTFQNVSFDLCTVQ